MESESPRGDVGTPVDAAGGARDGLGRAYDPAAEWRCVHPDCPRGEVLTVGHRAARRAGFLRHVCYGHGRERDPARPPLTIDVCPAHATAWQQRHGLGDEPEWLRRERMERASRLAHAADLGPAPALATRISRQVGNG